MKNPAQVRISVYASPLRSPALPPIVVLLVSAALASGLSAPQDAVVGRLEYGGVEYPLYPATLQDCPDIPSPHTTPHGDEIVVAFHEADQECTLIPVTVENGEPLDYRRNLWGPGEQLLVDRADFPTLSRTGLHSEEELARTTTITGRPVDEITAAARPGQASSIGFMAADEDVISVLVGDNRLVERMGLTHKELARPIFHLWNIVRLHHLQMLAAGRPLPHIDGFRYHGNTVRLIEAEHGKGWQESIFDDEILGMYQIVIHRDLARQETAFLRERYGHLGPDRYAQVGRTLSTIHLGEMIAYYIQRYGFYEGHTGWRVDPIAVASVFNLISIEELARAFAGELFDVLTIHHTPENLTPQ
jgi:hypothetical protein